MEIAVFVYGFSKTDRKNLDNKELKYLKKLAKDLLAISSKEYARQVKLGHFFSFGG